MPRAALFAVSCLLTSCATPSAPPAERPAGPPPDPRLCAILQAEPPVLGGIVQPATEEERRQTQAFLEGEAAARAWGRAGWERAGLAMLACSA